MKDKFVVFWNSLTTRKRKILALSGVATAMSLIAFLGWSQATKKPIIKQRKDVSTKEIKIGGDLMGKSQILESQAETAKLKQEIEDMRAGRIPIHPLTPAQLAAANGQTAPTPGQLTPTTPGQIMQINPQNQQAINTATNQNGQASLPGAVNGNKSKKKDAHAGMDLPPLPQLPAGALPPLPMPSSSGSHQADQKGRGAGGMGDGAVEYGDIAVVSNASNSKGTTGGGSKEDKKKENRTVYLPGGSFMEATLLSGLDAPTNDAGKGHPVPVLLRVKMPAVLPNDVKAALTKGCFVIADGRGNLGTERAELTLVSMACMDRKGNAVIDQKIKGWIVDEDGRAGLKGIPTAKFGSMVARSMLAGFLGGMGSALDAASKSNSVSALGINTVTQTGEQAVFSGIGKGLSTAFTETQKFYMELARTMLPVISVGSSKVATLIIAEGVSLEIKKSVR